MKTEMTAVAARRGRAHRIDEVAKILNCSRRTVEREIAAGRLKCHTLSARAKRVFDDAIDSYLERTRGEQS
jgi:excisionase family DNA binding protein